MSFKIHRKKKESSQSLIRRFSRRIRRSGILIRARQAQYRKRPKSNKMKKRAALRREELKKEYQRKKKMGEI